MPYARPSPAFLSEGKLVEIAQFASHWAEAAIASAEARSRLGNLSPSITQTTGPHDIPKKNTNAFAAISATVPSAPFSIGCPWAPIVAVPRVAAITPDLA